MAFALLIVQSLVLINGLALIGQLLVGTFNWPARQGNPVYRLFQLIASPAVKLVRLVTPRIVLDQHVPIAAFLLLFFAYFWLGFQVREVCRQDINQAGCQKWATAGDGKAAAQ
jgi:uncharacterized protein YggT (Ycf19 family)